MSDPSLSCPQIPSEVEVDSAMRQLSFVNWKMNSMNADIRKLEREMTDLRLRIHKKESSLRTKWKERQRTTAGQYSKLHLRHWSSALYAALPRELRDMIYSHCLDHDWDDKVLIESLEVLYGFSRPQWWNHDRLREYVLLDPSFVVKEVAIEVVEMIFARAQVPSFGMNRREGKPRVLHLKEFLKRDFFGLGVRPADHIRRLELKLQKSKLSTRNRHALRDNIKSLLLCRYNRNLHIEICFARGNSAMDVLFFLYILYSTYTALVSPRITFDITYKRRILHASTAGVDNDETQILNLMHMFELPQKIWRDHLMALCESVGHLPRRERRWLKYRALKKGRDVWANMEGETLGMLDSHGRDVWVGKAEECPDFWGECYPEGYWHEGWCLETMFSNGRQ